MERLFPPFTQRERQFLWALSLVAILCAGIPLLVGVLRLPPEKVFIGFGGTARNDNGIYLSYIEQARVSGHVFFANVFAPEPHTQSFFQPLWAVIGFISRLFHLAPVLVFHFVRLASIPLLVLAIYRFAGLLLPTIRGRAVATTLGIFGSGVGLYLLPFIKQLPGVFPPNADSLPADIIVPTLSTFQSIAHSPLFSLSLALLIFLVTLVLRDGQQPGIVPRPVLFAGTLLLALIHPYDVPILFFVVLGVGLVRYVGEPGERQYLLRQEGTRLGIMAAAGFAALLYFLAVLLIDKNMFGWAQQNVTPSPSWVVLGLGYGAMIPMYLWMAWKHRKILVGIRAVFWVWPLVVLPLSYAPVQVQVRFLNGMAVVLAVVVSLATEPFWQWLRQRRVHATTWVPAIVLSGIAVFCPTTLFTIAEPLVGGTAGQLRPVYQIDRATLEAVDWLRTQPPGITLSSDTSSFVISSRILRPTLFSDGSQTPQYMDQMQRARRVMQTGVAEDVFAFFHQKHIQYVFWTEREDAFYAPFSPDALPWLRQIFTNQAVRIYRFQP